MAFRGTKFYRKNEREVMLKLGIRPCANSGAGWIEKEDGQNDYIIAQLKSTDADSIKIVMNDVDILETNAAVAHKIPIFILQFLKNDDVFISVRPADLPQIAQYLDCGKCDIQSSEIVEELADSAPIVAKKAKKKIAASSSKSRERFREEQEEKWSHRRK